MWKWFLFILYMLYSIFFIIYYDNDQSEKQSFMYPYLLHWNYEYT